jgi:hypothetical protein
MNMYQIHSILRQFRTSFRAFFSVLTDQDFSVILTAPGETLLIVLQERYGYTRLQAKAAWNEFVLRYVDGRAPEERVEFAWVRIYTASLNSGKAIKSDYRRDRDLFR